MADEQLFDIPCVQADRVIDPTGCGDAYRAGLIHGIVHQLGWRRTGQLASLMGAIKIAQRGGQNHTPTIHAICQLYQQTFGEALRKR